MSNNVYVTENPIYLKEKIRYLYALNNYPDIQIKLSQEYSDRIKLRAELTLANGDILTEERYLSELSFSDERFVNAIQDDMLKDIGFHYIKRSFDERTKGNCNIKVGHVYYAIKDIVKNSEDTECQK